MPTLTQDRIDRLFTESTNQYDVWIALYREAFPDWDNIQFIDGYPVVSIRTGNYIAQKFVEFDHRHHQGECMPGGLWLNKGFSSKDGVQDWEIDTSPCKIEMKGGVNDERKYLRS